jgi:hypothetical protein
MTSTRTRAVALAAVAVLLTGMGCGGDDDDSPSAADPTTDTPTATESTRAEPAKVRVPRLTGLSLRQATRRLEARELSVGDVSKRPSAKPRRTVLDQGQRAGSRLRTGSTVSLVVAAPLPRVPDLVGVQRRDAKRELRRAGFDVRTTTKEQTDSASPGTVIDQTPSGGTRVRPGATVTITIAVRPPEPPPPADDCTSGYSPCLPPASDYDCAGGSGDGPAYAEGPISVTGSDPYGLDSDGDGVACET